MKLILLTLLSFSLYANGTNDLEKNLLSILDVQEAVLETSEVSINKRLSEWSLDSQKTDLAISKSGILGFSAVKGTTAVELSWSKREKVLKDQSVEERDAITLNSDMGEKEVIKAVRPTFKLLFKNRSKGYAHIQKNMEDHIIRYHRALKGVAQTSWGQYTPKKFRLDLVASFSSPLFGFSKLSGDTRMRLEWKISPSNKNNQRESDQKVVQNLLADLDEALKEAKVEEGYKLKEVSVGLGLSKKNLLSFSNIKGEIVGELYFKKNSSKQNLVEKSNLDGDYEVRSENKIFQKLKRRKFRKGLKKSFATTNWFASKFAKRSSKWEVNKFKTSFSLSYKGFLGLSNLSSKSLVTFTYKK